MLENPLVAKAGVGEKAALRIYAPAPLFELAFPPLVNSLGTLLLLGSLRKA